MGDAKLLLEVVTEKTERGWMASAEVGEFAHKAECGDRSEAIAVVRKFFLEQLGCAVEIIDALNGQRVPAGSPARASATAPKQKSQKRSARRSAQRQRQAPSKRPRLSARGKQAAAQARSLRAHVLGNYFQSYLEEIEDEDEDDLDDILETGDDYTADCALDRLITELDSYAPGKRNFDFPKLRAFLEVCSSATRREICENWDIPAPSTKSKRIEEIVGTVKKILG